VPANGRAIGDAAGGADAEGVRHGEESYPVRNARRRDARRRRMPAYAGASARFSN
jgi:hypothetical protein